MRRVDEASLSGLRPRRPRVLALCIDRVPYVLGTQTTVPVWSSESRRDSRESELACLSFV